MSSGVHENGGCGASKNFCQRVSTWSGPRSGWSAIQMTSGAISARNAFTSRSASVFAKAISVLRTCSVSAAMSAAKAPGTAQTINASNTGFMAVSLWARQILPSEERYPAHPVAQCRPFVDAGNGNLMGAFTTLMARDGHEFNAWLAPATGGARGAVVICQEIFGV